VLIGGLVLQGLSGIGGGLGLVLDPSGESVGIPLEWLSGSPFPDYLIPGVFLFTVLGIGPLLVAHGVWRRHPGSWAASVMVGVVLLLWIGIEIGVVGYQADPPLQLIYALLAFVILGAAALPGVRRHLRRRWNGPGP
jgi:hypothetical protein